MRAGVAVMRMAVVLPLVSGLVGVAQSAEIDASNYGTTTNGMPYAVAMAKGFFKEAGADITGVRGSEGGGTTVRNMLGGNMPYGEIALSAAVLAIQGGADLKIISENVYTVAEFYWLTRPDSPIRSLKDLKGKRIGFTNPQSTSQAMDYLLLEAAGLKESDVQLVKTGGFGAGITALGSNGIDIMPIAEPLYTLNESRFRVAFWAPEVLPPLCNVVGVTTGKAMRESPGLIRAILAGRNKAVAFMNANLDESAQLIAKDYRMDVRAVRNVLRNLIEKKAPGGLPYWSTTGQFNWESMNNMIRAQHLVGVIKGDVDWSKVIEGSFLPK
ncbi:MAG TPA: ABC transporter substrate-binding protein [Candidatus Methylomirabilis sp.]|nr:ABC transporter substrate-binding protein [Candidatus Methylomirabilis sp.]